MIPEAAVEAALQALFPTFPDVGAYKRSVWLPTIKTILEAAAPHMRQAFFLEMNLKAVAGELAAPPIYPHR